MRLISRMQNSNSIPGPSTDLLTRATDVRRASNSLGQTTDQQRSDALIGMADALEAKASVIVEANEQDIERSLGEGLNQALIARLKLNKDKLKGAIEGVRKVALLPDPLGRCHLNRELSKNLVLERITVPLGVVGVIFEARPDAVMQIASLAIRSGNGAILKGGSEALQTNEVIMETLREGLASTEISPEALSLLTTREESLALLKLDGLVDLIIPRGSNEFVRFIQDNTRIPVLGHADGICHLYVDSSADLDQALRIAIDSKTQYPAACNAIETLLVHTEVARDFFCKALPAFKKLGVTLLGDAESQSYGVEGAATERDWATEYLDTTLSIKIISGLEEAIEHIRCYGSRHTEAIVANDHQVAELFLQSVDSAGVFHNCSTRFADGFRYGFGAEVGISTQTLPPRGPVGLDGLVTYRYRLRGSGQTVADFASGQNVFSHKDLPL